ncbi:MAG: PHP domain-containing protein [Clostridia bacterium]|nr:PHP domain-containing protein [Clostridia bacterium]
MKFKIDHDYHIHSQISTCSKDPKQTPERILDYAQQYGLSKICITDHFWDETVKGGSSWYEPQNFEHVSAVLPLPKREGIDFYFGCETELNGEHTLGISRSTIDKFDFVIIPTTHLHMKNYTIRADATAEERAVAYVERLDAVLNMDLPFNKIGIAHLACGLIMPGYAIEKVLSLVSDEDLERLFKKSAELGVGIEINSADFRFSDKTPEQIEQVLRVFGLAKDAGCKFYLGSDAHHPKELDKAIPIFEEAAERLDLTENDKFDPFG